MSITLPEITIVGRANSTPETPSDWFCDGFMAGWNNPQLVPEAPAPLNEEYLSAYFSGVQAGKNCRNGVECICDDPQYDGPSVVNDLGGQPYEELEKAWKESWSEFLNHREDPHIEAPEIEFLAD
ncbi:MAG: hypothetical protein JO154_13670 [Chitinophaga sp.]|uniref:hypothetical protein n=1 Tax=Chitinophaga sp. TaxID=1869181 RepID=UPI0025BC8D8E|nr:hypothetical protein [Chitinophaga sp.]MBV8253651.1 hypothetical protein [Chitinophaga sp.]